MKTLVILLSLLCLVAPAEAKKKNKNNGQDKKEEKAKAEERKKREERYEAVKAFLEQKDKNNDGSLTREEFIAGEDDGSAALLRFETYNKNRDRYLSKTEIAAMLGFD